MDALLRPSEVQELVASGSVVVVDVMVPEDFEKRHIPGSVNACVYEMIFIERMAALVPDKDHAIVVYDATGTSMAARTAQEKLLRNGYQNVALLSGGLQAWQAAGYAVTESVPAVDPDCADGTYVIDTGASTMEWSGRNINNRHFGRLTIAHGTVVLAGGELQSAAVEVDMNSITDLDLKDEGWRAMLIQHLKSDDFFDVEHYPTVVFEMIEAGRRAVRAPGVYDLEVTGTLQIKDVARRIIFPATIAAQEDGSIKAHACIDFDRTLWNVAYGSGRLYERLGMHLVHDMISVELFLVARKDR